MRSERDIVNIHSVLTKCFECGMIGINLPDVTTCGNCNSSDTVRYYDEKTVLSILSGDDTFRDDVRELIEAYDMWKTNYGTTFEPSRWQKVIYQIDKVRDHLSGE